MNLVWIRPAFLPLLWALLGSTFTGATQQTRPSPSSYEILYTYDTQLGQVVQAAVTVPGTGTWTTRYVYGTLLKEGQVIGPDGNEFAKYLYDRDSAGRLVRKTINDPSGSVLGGVRIEHDEAGRVIKVIVGGPSELPNRWDPAVDR